MPIIAVIVGGIITGLTYWLMYGNGMEQIDQLLRDRRNAKLRQQSQAAFEAAPVRSIKNPVDAAGVLMQLVALARGTPTPEQEAEIESRLRAISEPGDDIPARLVFTRHAATQASDPESAIDHLAPLLREKLGPDERHELEAMLEAVAVIHNGPTETQERLIARTVRKMAEEA